MKKFLKRLGLITVMVLIVVIAAVVILFGKELKTLSTLKKIDDHPLYTMTYYGDYGFDDFLKVGADNDKAIEKFVTKRLLRGIEINFNVAKGGCTAFAATNAKSERIYGRNFDFDDAPALLIHTKPDNGYASVSMVNLSYAGYTAENLPKPMNLNSFLTLAAPYLPFDGMNECGVAIALLAVPQADPPKKPGQVSLNTTTAIRLVLDKAKSTDEAVSLLKQYNFYFSDGVESHYLISDTSGKSVIVEFLEGDVKVTETDKSYQVASNFIAYNGLNIGEGYDEFKRYDIVCNVLEASNGILSEEDAMNVLSNVKIEGRTQWSIVYNMVTKDFSVCMEENYSKVYGFNLTHFK